MKAKFIKLINRSFIRNVAVMATGTALAQIITMMLSPIITRLYGPEAFGIMGTFGAIISIIAPVSALTYPIAIVLPEHDRDAKGLIHLSLIVILSISIFSLIFLFLFNNQIINIFNLSEVSHFMYLIPLVIIFSGLMQVAEQWLIRTRQFVINARVTVIQSIIINGSKVGIGFITPVASVLVLLSVLANGLKALMMVFFAKRAQVQNESKGKRKSLKRLAKEYYDFPLYRAPEVFLNAISQGFPVLMLTAFFGTTSAGFYTIGRTVLGIPSRLIGQSVGDVFYPRIAEAAKNKEDVTVLIKRATLALAGIGILPFGMVVLFGPYLFSLVFGSDWIIAGEYARWISLWSFFAFMNRPSVRALPVLNAQRFHLIYTIIMLVIRLVTLVGSYYIFSNDLVAIALFSISGAILNFGLISFTVKISQQRMVENE